MQNAALAVKLTISCLNDRDPDLETDGETFQNSVLKGLRMARWPGRCQKVSDPKHSSIMWFLDGAHTTESLQCCMEWYVRPGAALLEPSE